jgi:predicted metal-dependent hydrolase
VLNLAVAKPAAIGRSEMADTKLPTALTEFVQLFNHGSYWASHEALEKAWHEGRSDFYHGLILLASAFVHLERRNEHGIMAQLTKAEPLLRQYRPHYLGIDVEHLLGVAAHLRGDPSATPSRPQIGLDAGWVRGDEKELTF